MTRDLVKELVTFKAEAKQHIKRTLMDHQDYEKQLRDFEIQRYRM